jgi:hypothetical protein
MHAEFVHPVRARLDLVLRGRSMRRWAASVRLTAGTAQRLVDGHFPDPERLLPAVRIERLSLNWLLDGTGTPFSVHAPATDKGAARLLETILTDEPGAKALLLHSLTGFTVVIHRPAEAAPLNGEPYSYVATDVIGGGALRAETAKLLVHLARGIREYDIDEPDRTRLASGYMSNTELFGWDGADPAEQGGLLARSKPLSSVREPIADFNYRLGEELAGPAATYLVEQERDVIRIFRSLEKRDQATVLKMLRGLDPRSR